MSNEERTFERPTDYSKWHRNNLPSYCYMQDIDCIEYRLIDDEPVPVAVVETGRWDRVRFTDIQKQIVLFIANKLEIPAYFIEYKIDVSNNNLFKITNLKSNKENVVLRNNEFMNFLVNIGDNWNVRQIYKNK